MPARQKSVLCNWIMEVTSDYLAIIRLLEAVSKIIPAQREGIIYVWIMEMGIFRGRSIAGQRCSVRACRQSWLQAQDSWKVGASELEGMLVDENILDIYKSVIWKNKDNGNE